MSKYAGDFAPASAVRIRFNTHKADGTPITLAGTPAISVYKDGSTTESTAGVTLAVDFDGRTGLHLVTIDTSADGTFYSAGSDFHVVVTAGTVDSISVVGSVVGGFSLNNRSALRPATAGRSLAVDASGRASADVDTIKTQSVTCAAGVTVLASVGTASTSTAQTGDSYARIGAAGAGLTAVGDARLANLDVAVSTRLASVSYTAAPAAATVAAAVWVDSTGAAVATATTTLSTALIDTQTTGAVADNTGTTTQFTVSGLSQSKNYVGMMVLFTSGANDNTRQLITGQANASSNVRLTVGTAFGAAPASGDTISVF